MLALIFDTETTGLPEKNASIDKLESWPHVLQLSFIVFNLNTNSIVASKDYYIKINKSVEISEKSQEIHGISYNKLKENGIHIKPILYDFKRYLNICNLVIGHNINFDINMMIIEGKRNKIPVTFINKLCICTMKSNINFCNIIRVNKYNREFKKFPSLLELFNQLFPNEKVDKFHNSFADILVTLRCYYKKEFDNDLFETNRRYKKLYLTHCY